MSPIQQTNQKGIYVLKTHILHEVLYQQSLTRPVLYMDNTSSTTTRGCQELRTLMVTLNTHLMTFAK